MTTQSKHKPQKPSPDFPLTPHSSGKWCKKIAGKLRYFGTWDDPDGALQEFEKLTKGAGRPAKPKENSQTLPTPKDFPLYAHKNGQWAKTIAGRKYYFGPLSDPEGAKRRYLEERVDLENGRIPAARQPSGLSLQELVNQFDNSKRVAMEKGRLDAETYRQYQAAEKRLIEFFGPDRIVESLRPVDFDRYAESLPENWGLVTFRNFVVYTRAIFNFASDEDVGLIEQRVRFGKLFRQPKKRDLNVERNKRPPKFFEADEIRKLLLNASPMLKAMILLGVNCGFGNRDIAELTTSIYDASSDWLDYARNKTGVKRKCHLWPETKTAIKDALKDAPKPRAGHEHYLFVSRFGRGWYKNGPSAISYAFRKLTRKCKMDKPGRGFYSLRHVFQTIGETSGDLAAVKYIMGHQPSAGDMSSVYREKMFDDRLLHVSQTVRKWLYPKATD